MAGTIVADTIQNGAGTSTSMTNAISGSAKAWCNFDGYTGGGNTIYGSYNVSSVTKNGTGDYTLNFTTAMANTNYAYAGLAAFGEGNTTATGRYVSPYVSGTGTYPFGLSTTSLRFTTTYAVNTSNQDCQFVSIIVCGNQ